jgi:hypothetical protein
MTIIDSDLASDRVVNNLRFSNNRSRQGGDNEGKESVLVQRVDDFEDAKQEEVVPLITDVAIKIDQKEEYIFDTMPNCDDDRLSMDFNQSPLRNTAVGLQQIDELVSREENSISN